MKNLLLIVSPLEVFMHHLMLDNFGLDGGTINFNTALRCCNMFDGVKNFIKLVSEQNLKQFNRKETKGYPCIV